MKHKSGHMIFFAFLIVIQVMFLLLPLCILFYKGIFAGDFLKTFAWFLEPHFFSIIIKSMGYALITAISCFLIAFPVTLFISFSSETYKKVLLLFLCAPFLNNFLLHIASWTFLFQSQGIMAYFLKYLGIIEEHTSLLYTTGSLLTGMIYCYMPFMLVPLYVALEKFDYRLCEASYDLGATWYHTLFKVILPSISNAIVAGMVLVFVPACTEFFIPELLGGDTYMSMGSLLSLYTYYIWLFTCLWSKIFN